MCIFQRKSITNILNAFLVYTFECGVVHKVVATHLMTNSSHSLFPIYFIPTISIQQSNKFDGWMDFFILFVLFNTDDKNLLVPINNLFLKTTSSSRHKNCYEILITK